MRPPRVVTASSERIRPNLAHTKASRAAKWPISPQPLSPEQAIRLYLKPNELASLTVASPYRCALEPFGQWPVARVRCAICAFAPAAAKGKNARYRSDISRDAAGLRQTRRKHLYWRSTDEVRALHFDDRYFHDFRGRGDRLLAAERAAIARWHGRRQWCIWYQSCPSWIVSGGKLHSARCDSHDSAK